MEPTTERSRLSRVLGPKVGIPILIILGLVLAPFIYRSSQLAGIPDIGDPFDVNAFCALDLPESDNGYADYERAKSLLLPEPNIQTNEGVREMDWGTAPPEYQKWVLDNRATLVAWKQGAEKLHALSKDAALGINNSVGAHIKLYSLARLEASRLQFDGDLTGAWQIHRAILRQTRHCGQHEDMVGRLIGVALHAFAARSILPWAADPHVTEAMLQSALTDARSIFAMTAPQIDTVKAQYLSQRALLPERVDATYQVTGEKHSWLEVFLLCEPELSGRILQHSTADVLETLDPTSTSIHPHLSSLDLAIFIDKSIFGSRVAMDLSGLEAGGRRERAHESALEMALASQIYHRRHQRFPEKVEQLLECGLPAIPVDPHRSPGPMQYRLDPTTGDAIIWSIGANGIDDGGDSTIVDYEGAKDTVFIVRPPQKPSSN